MNQAQLSVAKFHAVAQANVDEALRDLHSRGVEAVGCAAHVGSLPDLQRLAHLARDTYGRVDVLVSNAAVNPAAGLILDMPDSAIDKILDINIKAAILLTREVRPLMPEVRLLQQFLQRRSHKAKRANKLYLGPSCFGTCKRARWSQSQFPQTSLLQGELLQTVFPVAAPPESVPTLEPLWAQGSNIVFISSYTAYHAEAPIAMYAVSKTALVALAKALAEELGPAGIRVNCVAPGTGSSCSAPCIFD